MKVLHLIDSLNTGGAEMLAVNSVNLLNNAGIDAYLCATREEGLLKQRVEKIDRYIFLNRKAIFDKKAQKKILRFIDVNEISIIHAHSSSYFFAVLIKLYRPSIKILHHIHNGEIQQQSFTEQLTLKLASYFISTFISVNSEILIWAKDFYHNSKGYYVKNFSQVNLLNENLTKLKGAQRIKICQVGSLRRVKNHNLVIDSIDILKRKGLSVSLHLFGDVSDKNYHKEILKRISDLDLHNDVYIYGNKRDIHQILLQGDIGVLGSNSEGLPIALLDYGMASLPVVVTEVGQCAEVLENGKYGVLVPRGNSKIFASGLEKLILNKDLCRHYGLLFNQRVKTEYSSEKYIDNLKNIYSNA